VKRFINLLFLAVLGIIYSCSPTISKTSNAVPAYTPESKPLHDTIARLDSILFDAYNNCKLDVFESLISEDIEFYHDRGGLSKSKKDLVQSIKNNICGRITRELLPGSIEVYPIPGYGAVQMGAHRFFNNQEKERGTSHFSKFVHTWHRENGQWKVARVISLH
jgi:hypothetical protein